MASTQANRAASGGLDCLLRPPGEPLQFVGLLLVLSFSVVTNWHTERWQESAAQIALFVLGMFAAARAALFGARWPATWLQLPLAGAVLWGLAQLVTRRTVYPFETWVAILGWLTLFFAFSSTYQILSNPALRRAFRLFAIYFGSFIAIWAILQLFSAEGKILWIYASAESPQPMGPFLSYDHYSAFIELLLPIALWEAVLDRRRAVLFGCLAAIMYASVIAGASRAGSVLVNLELGLVVLLALTRKIGKHGNAAGQAPLRIGLLVLTFTAVVGWDVLLKRFQTTDPFVVRREVWQAGLSMIRDHPWFGFGLGTWTLAYPRYAAFDPQAFVNAAHNDWLQWAGEGGVPFAFLLFIVCGRALQLGWKAPWGLGVVVVFLHSLVDFSLQTPSISLWTIVTIAALEAGRVRSHSEEL